MRDIRQIDASTGEELVNSTLAVVFPKRRNLFLEWFAMNQETMDKIISLKRASDLRVMLWLLQKMNFHNKATVFQSDICDELEMHAPNVSASIKRLIGHKLVTKTGRHEFTVCPYDDWKGDTKDQRRAQVEWDRHQREAAA